MPRLPKPGADAGSWGRILNEYLSTSISEDGTLNTDTVGAAQLKSNSVTNAAIASGINGAKLADTTIEEAKLSTAVQTKLNATNAVTSVATKTGAVTLDKNDVGLNNVDNTSDAGKPISTAVQTALNGKQASGSYALTSDLAGKVNTSSVGAANGVASLGSDSRVPDAQLPTRLGASELDNKYVTVNQNGELEKGGVVIPISRSLVPRGNRAVFLGDSTVTEGSPPARSRVLSWPTLASMFTGARMFRAANFAVSGYTSAGVLNTQIPQVLADPTGFGEAHLCVGTNDLATGMGGIASGITPAITKANITSIADALENAGIRLVLYTIPPRTAAAITNGASGPVPNVHAKTQAFNAWLKTFAKERKLQVVDLWAQAVNPITGEYKTTYSADGIHAAGPGLVYEAERVALEVNENYPAWQPPLAGAFDETAQATQLLPNPLFTTDSNADGIPDGWSIDSALSSAYSVSLIDGPGMLGKEMVIQNASSPPGGARLLADTITSGFAVGDTIGFGCKIAATSTFGSQAMIYTVKITYLGASSNGTLAPINAWQSTLPGIGTLWVEDVIPAGTNGIQVEVRLHTNSQGRLAVSQMTLRNLTAALTNGWWAA